MFTEVDKQDYIDYLQQEKVTELAQPETIARAVNLDNINQDLKSLKDGDSTKA